VCLHDVSAFPVFLRVDRVFYCRVIGDFVERLATREKSTHAIAASQSHENDDDRGLRASEHAHPSLLDAPEGDSPNEASPIATPPSTPTEIEPPSRGVPPASFVIVPASLTPLMNVLRSAKVPLNVSRSTVSPDATPSMLAVPSVCQMFQVVHGAGMVGQATSYSASHNG
jgi:hypothetical protein